ncbi:enoyl-CoA hydratase/isomerase family protein [Aurantimonas manganoxydans SI85-9A1]|uniref:Enoyl-CoA hydratase/isomerase family protein n=1 Tax=Aurantimonas manganoxydans (strain ATCC BAA-1229 / DSM 21871 / SI85-9A1) TaxID=287752 RepID=Q1YGG1_AURMS|nr:enoyl-CoA hydratase/isomerase family protein [Aurantimonas manganoxydans]EAS49264.1 enoyl-CoA hydratase/isomerase family protein [Aurantimonas manganoxydans SI85-9A1]
MSNDELLYEVRDGIGWITLNRPQARNALTFAMYDRLAEICRETKLGGAVKCLVVTGAGDKAFAAGTDMTQFRGFDTEQDALDYEHRIDVVLGAVEACPVPTIAAIARACTGGGAGIAAACDIRIATADLKFGFPIARTLGNCLSIANLSRLSTLMGAGRVKEIIFTARLVGAEEALNAGLIAEIVPDHAALIARTEELAALLATHAPLTLSTTKEALRRLRVQGAETDDRDLVVQAYMSEDFKEGMEAFLGKRKPEWKGQ